MKINKKFWPLFLTIGTTVAFPLASVSCLYNDNPTVTYALQFQNDNGFTAKKAEFYNAHKELFDKKPALLQFVNSLEDTNILTYTFQFWNYQIKNSFEITNDSLKVKIANPFNIIDKGRNISVNTEILNDNVPADKRTYYTDLINKTAELLTKYYKEIERISADKKKDLPTDVYSFQSLTQLSSTEGLNLTKTATEIITNLKTLRTAEYYNVEGANADKIITYDDVKNLIIDFFKGTPFLYVILNDLTITDNGRPVITKMPTSDSRVNDFKFDFSNNAGYFNNYQTPKYQDAMKFVMNQTSKLNYSAMKNLEKTNLIKIFNDFLQNNKSFIVKDKDINPLGFANGFAPSYLLTGSNPDSPTLQYDAQFMIFQSEYFKTLSNDYLNNPGKTILTDQQEGEFVSDPVEFVKQHRELLNYSVIAQWVAFYKTTITNIEKYSSETNSKNKKEIPLLKEYKATLEETRNEILQMLSELKTLEESILTIKANKTMEEAAKNSAVQQKEAEITKIMQKPILVARYNKRGRDQWSNIEFTFLNGKPGSHLINDADARGYNDIVADVTGTMSALGTNIASFNSMMGKIMFSLGAFNVQVIQGTKDTKSTFWLEIKNGDKWYMVDLYQAYLDFQNSKNSETPKLLTEAHFHETLPSNYAVNETFAPYTNVK
ncbi:hypothetical protein [Mycoplasma sp. Sp33II]|uniref:hypothetical protein n=1 Tax=unclassified Mycoplasma TaxID=2683645 RepID=UPI003AAF6E47